VSVRSRQEIETREGELRRLARSDPRTHALTRLRGIGPILACILLAEIGDIRRFRRARQITRAAGLDPSVLDSADAQRRGRLAKAGSPQLRFALVEAATRSGRVGGPDRELYLSVRHRAGAQRANLTVARKIGRRVYHVLRELEPAA
jgi:transposase